MEIAHKVSISARCSEETDAVASPGTLLGAGWNGSEAELSAGTRMCSLGAGCDTDWDRPVCDERGHWRCVVAGELEKEVLHDWRAGEAERAAASVRAAERDAGARVAHGAAQVLLRDRSAARSAAIADSDSDSKKAEQDAEFGAAGGTVGPREEHAGETWLDAVSTVTG